MTLPTPQRGPGPIVELGVWVLRGRRGSPSHRAPCGAATLPPRVQFHLGLRQGPPTSPKGRMDRASEVRWKCGGLWGEKRSVVGRSRFRGRPLTGTLERHPVRGCWNF